MVKNYASHKTGIVEKSQQIGYDVAEEILDQAGKDFIIKGLNLHILFTKEEIDKNLIVKFSRTNKVSHCPILISKKKNTLKLILVNLHI